MGTAQELDRVRRELREATAPERLAVVAGGRATLFDDRVEIAGSTIALVPGETHADVTVSGSGRTAVVYLSVSGPDGNRSLRLRGDDEVPAREFVAAVGVAAERVEAVRAERERRVQELAGRVSMLTASADADAGAPAPQDLVTDELLADELMTGDPVIDDLINEFVIEGLVVDDVLPEPSAVPEPRPAAAAETFSVTDLPDPSRVPDADPPAEPERRRHRAVRRPGRPTRPGRPPRQRRRRRVPVAAILVATLGATASLVTLLRPDLPVIGTGADDDPAGGGTSVTAGPTAGPTPEPTEPRDRTPASGSPVGPPAFRLDRAVRDRFDVLDLAITGGLFTVSIRQDELEDLAEDAGAIFTMVHDSGLDPRSSTVRHYATVVDPQTGESSVELVGVYRMSRAQSRRTAWGGPIEIRWDDFLTYRTARWPG